MNTLDYEAPKPRAAMGSGFIAFWSTFIGSAILGLQVSHLLDNMWELHYLGHRSYNDMAPLLLAGSLFGAIVVGIIRVVRGGKKTGWRFSTTFGFFSPILVLVGLIVPGVIGMEISN